MEDFDILMQLYHDSRMGIKELLEDFLDYLSKSKYDFESIARLRLQEPARLLPILPHLLAWIQDSNWPILNEMVGLSF